MFLAERNIAAFYRHTFSEATVLPKMHILEDHVIPWMCCWYIGSGLMGEQGAESIHAHLLRLEIQYNGIVNPLERLKYVIKEHNIESSLGFKNIRPAPRKYGKLPRDDSSYLYSSVCSHVSVPLCRLSVLSCIVSE